MKLLSENELIWSSVVANSAMNRERNASGINSYEKEFKFRPEQFITTCIEQYGQASWLDVCCGQGKALIQTAGYLVEKGLQHKCRLTGIDLIDSFLPIPPSIQCLRLEIGSVVDRIPESHYDLITCVHGLHYIGDKLKVIGNIVNSLAPAGTFIANLDLQNIQISGVDTKSYLQAIFKENNISYSTRTKIISCKGPLTIHFNLNYEGASDLAGPNYTGQEAVNSYYTIPV